MRKRWTGLATALALVSSALVLNGTLGAQANHPGGTWTLYAAGDIADPDSPGDEMNAAIIKAGIDADPDHTRVLMLGDGAYPDGSIDTYNREYGKSDGWGQFKDKTYPVPGNHDYGTQMGPANAGYRLYWDERLKEMQAAGGQTLTDQSGWYSFELGNWHIIALNWACGEPKPGATVKGTGTSCREDGPQAQWLAADLAKAKANNKHIIAMWHGARFFTKNDNGTPDKAADDPGGNSSDAAKTNTYWKMLHAAGAEIVLGSHHHNYEQFDRMSVVQPADAPAGDDQGQIDPTGPRSFVVGTGGGQFHSFNPDAGVPAVGSKARIEKRFGVLKLVLGENDYSWQFIASDKPGGEVLDQGSSATLKTVAGSGGTTTTTTGGGGTTTTTAPGGVVNPTNRKGYWMVGADGKVYPFGQAARLGDAGVTPGTQAVDLEPTPSGDGYWVVDEAGAVARFGDALYYGAPDSVTLKPGENVTSLSSTATGKGYWMFTNKGRVLAFGDATHYGDVSKTNLNAPVLDSIVTSTGKGYYMVAGDGGIFAFGDAAFYGSMGNTKLNKPVQSLVPDADGVGYWLVASDGGIFAFEAPFKGSLGSVKLNKPVTGMVRYADGYLMVAEDGGIFNFSNEQFLGSLGGSPLARPIVSVAALG
ncbi:MAG: metallophosphoesterase [Actinomycetota bacterium]